MRTSEVARALLLPLLLLLLSCLSRVPPVCASPPSEPGTLRPESLAASAVATLPPPSSAAALNREMLTRIIRIHVQLSQLNHLLEQQQRTGSYLPYTFRGRRSSGPTLRDGDVLLDVYLEGRNATTPKLSLRQKKRLAIRDRRRQPSRRGSPQDRRRERKGNSNSGKKRRTSNRKVDSNKGGSGSTIKREQEWTKLGFASMTAADLQQLCFQRMKRIRQQQQVGNNDSPAAATAAEGSRGVSDEQQSKTRQSISETLANLTDYFQRMQQQQEQAPSPSVPSLVSRLVSSYPGVSASLSSLPLVKAAFGAQAKAASALRSILPSSFSGGTAAAIDDATLPPFPPSASPADAPVTDP